MSSIWAVGDIHGSLEKLRLLLQRAGLINHLGHWTGKNARLVFLGDYLDRGPDGLGVIRFIRDLERLAPLAGGRVAALLGNHEVMFLAAQKFRLTDPADQLGFYRFWSNNGGDPFDQDRLAPEDTAWLQARPLIGRAGTWLLTHADSTFYLEMGKTIEEVNHRAQEIFSGDDPQEWHWFAHTFLRRLEYAGKDGAQAAKTMLDQYGGRRILHGHSPVTFLLVENEQNLYGDPALPVEYADGLCVDIDSGMAYFPDMGFIVRLQGRELTQVISLPPQETMLDVTHKILKTRHGH